VVSARLCERDLVINFAVYHTVESTVTKPGSSHSSCSMLQIHLHTMRLAVMLRVLM
jgi:hypothetical protein